MSVIRHCERGRDMHGTDMAHDVLRRHDVLPSLLHHVVGGLKDIVGLRLVRIAAAVLAVSLTLAIASQLQLGIFGQPEGEWQQSGLSLYTVSFINETASKSPFDKDWPNTIAICLMVKLEPEEDLREWLQYHRCALPRSLTIEATFSVS